MEARRVIRGILVGLSIAGIVLLATRSYLVRELVVVLGVLTIFVCVGTGVLLFVQICVRWSNRKITGAQQNSVASPGNPRVHGPLVGR
ncbi:MAG TPA: hypothetical protein VJX29_00560 [Candidatus Acidoferrales bacterium]|nr:hypothetical protein [Candidatus Acidoferrales bacterium]